MRASIVLANAAEAVNSKLYIVGGAWDVIGPGPVTFTVALIFKLDWNELNTEHSFRLELQDADGNTVTYTVDGEDRPLDFGDKFEVAPLPGIRPGTSLSWLALVNIVGLDLPPGSDFLFRLWIDDVHRDEWSWPFSSRKG